MKKLRGILLIGVLMIGTLLFASCGGTTSTPEEVASKYLENITKKDFNDENVKKETLDLIHSSVSNKEDAIEASKNISEMFDSVKKEFESYGAGEKFEEFKKATIDGIKIEKKKETIENDTAEVEYLITVPTIDQLEFKKKIENLVAEKLKNTKLEDLDKNALMNESVDLIISEIKKGEKLEKEDITIELKKDGKNWAITSTY
ncbi:hypothetical protein [Clostridium thermobutyricum]|uniref:Uncharacterized protein n=1 Tax=Clostridium thermobutyricum DSM 4928 TaxID=1121339 RepID=A0A1V4SSR2_9CLOT|nr:hypothetical protein [Clostridium thermobutyricum]OPX46920.1 hypothetical protein CLTHE_23970 [Clostridium thermobutyricum DSM 4928]